jgi:hydrogenase nickel incorporation protein HypA/HybF
VHELSLAQGICHMISERVGRRRLAAIRLEVGALSGVNADSLEFCLGEVARIEGLGEPTIEIDPVTPRMRCACGREYPVEDILDACPDCGGYERQVVAGTELTVTSVDLPDEDETDASG